MKNFVLAKNSSREASKKIREDKDFQLLGGKDKENLVREARKKFRDSEVWYQDPEDSNLWYGEHGLIINTAALIKRKDSFEILLSRPDAGSFHDSREQTRQLAL